jgi:two-component system catabolic regulation response regulator CreB
VKILIVEDDPGIVDVLDYALRKEGYSVETTNRGAQAVELAADADFILLDVGLPDLDGFEVCRRIRKKHETPILFLTSRAEEVDRIVGLELGGDDYLAKPFSTRELLARIKAIIRRTSPSASPAGAEFALVIDREKHAVRHLGKTVDLSRVEFDLLALLAGQPGRVFTRNQILDSAWPDGGCVTDRTVDAHIKSLRKKLGDPAAIETVRGVGYRLSETLE